MHVTYQLTAEDYRQGLLAWRKVKTSRQWFVRVTVAVCGVIVVFSLARLFVHPDRETVQSAAILVGLATAYCVALWTNPWFSARKQYRSMPTAQSAISMDFSDKGLQIHSVHSDSQVLWSAYVGWGENKSVFVILPQPRIFVPIPKRAFSEHELGEFREILRRNVGKK